MKIYLIRHGESALAADDNNRALTELGRAQLQRLAAFLAPLQLTAARLWQSEKLRTQQTAEILSASMRITESTETLAALEPLGLIEPLIKKLQTEKKDTIIVGHLPLLGRLLSQLVVDDPRMDVVLFEPGTLICLEWVEEELWVIQWVLNPRLFELPAP